MWSSSSGVPSSRPLTYGHLPPEMAGMVGLRDVFVVAPAAAYHHNNRHHHHGGHDTNLLSETHHHSINASNNPVTALGVGVGVGVIPLLTATTCLAPPNMSNIDDDEDNNTQTSVGMSMSMSMGIGMGMNMMSSGHHRHKRSSGGAAGAGGGGIQVWQQNEPHFLEKTHHHEAVTNLGRTHLVQGSGGSGGGGGNNNTSIMNAVSAASAGASTMTCQDCGNQVKKDCTHRRCRTCCKSRGFDCATHVKSTWVPAARRRERQLMSAACGSNSGSTSSAKKPRLIGASQTTTSRTSTSNTTPPRSYDTSSSHQDAGFKDSLPGQVRAPAVFKCVRVTAVDDGEDEYAYQAVVKVGGHVFKGFLYDQGVEGRDGFPDISELQLGGGCGGGSSGDGNGGRNGASSPILDPSDVYAASSGGLLGGSNFGNPIN